MKISNPILAALIIFLLMSISGCASLKDTKIGKFYHNVTARYNGYFNAREIVRITEEDFKANYQENYNEVLPVFRYPQDKGASAGPQMDEVIKKCSKVIQKHPKSKWVDDCYFLIGKAYFYKDDGFAAIDVFQYVSSTYKQLETGKLADIWIARTYMQMDNLSDAGALVTRLKTGKKIQDEDVKRELLLTEAAISVENQTWQSAAKALEEAIPLVKKKKERTRLTFILAQVYERMEKPALANETYNKVTKMNPSYELSFYSRLHVARAYEVGSGSSQEIKSTLRKLLRDDKNIEYFDQIYYELAIISLKEGNTEQALKDLRTSVAVSQSNSNQKARSFLKIAEIQFENKNYVLAKNYYDSASSVITPEYPDYDAVVARKNVLDQLIDAFITIEREDSLQKLAAMPKAELEKYINALIEKEKEAGKQAQSTGDDGFNSPLAMQSPDMQRQSQNQGSGSNWYFYNYANLAIGYSEFVKRWGERPLQDNWRVLTTAVTNPEAEKNDPDLAEELKKANSGLVPNEFADVPPDQQQYYQNLPFNPVQRAASDNRLVDAYFTLGTLYYEDLEEYTHSVENYETLLRRFPDNTHSLRTYYNLYLVYTELGRINEAEKYKNILFKQYPESEYTMLIKDPDALKKKFEARNENPELDNLYKQAWNSYQRSNCKKVTEASIDAEALVQGATKLPRFEYLRLLCEGKNMDKEIFRQQLEDFVQKYPNEPMRPHAENLIGYLGGGSESGDTTNEEGQSAEQSKYAENNTGRFMYVLVYPRKDASAQRMKESFSDYNKKFQSLGSFQINSIVLDDNNQILMVQDFEDSQKAKQYYNDLEKNPRVFTGAGLKNYDHFIISFNNFTLFMRDKDVQEYLEFFNTEIKNKK